jgi:hypothetical protein
MNFLYFWRLLLQNSNVAKMWSKMFRLALLFLLFTALACSSARQPWRPEVNKKRNRNCDCSRWSYQHQPVNTVFVYEQG